MMTTGTISGGRDRETYLATGTTVGNVFQDTTPVDELLHHEAFMVGHQDTSGGGGYYRWQRCRIVFLIL